MINDRSKTSPRRTLRAALVAVPAAAFLLAGCGTGVTTASDEPVEGEAVTVQNCGREVTVHGVPEAAVGLHPAQTELLLRLGLADHLAGQGQAAAQQLPDDVASLAADVPVIGGVMPPSREDLLAVEPDFVYSPTTYEFSADQGFASIEQLNSAGAAVYVATGGCEDRRMTGEVTDLFVDLQNLGELFAIPDRAAELVTENQAELDHVATAVSDVEPLRVAQIYYEGGNLQAIGAGVEYDILSSAGADNVYTPDQPAFADFFAATITPESLAAEAPDAIVFAAYDADHEAATREYLRDTFPDLPAVANDRLIAVSTSDMFPGTLGNISAVHDIAESLYPEAFGR